MEGPGARYLAATGGRRVACGLVVETRAEIVLDLSALERLRARLADVRLGLRLGEDWEHGVSRAWLTELLADWQRYEPARLQARLDRLEHRRVELDGLSIHLVQTPGVGPDPLPLLLTHGWPGSFLEYAELVPRLADPASDGADFDDAFVVVTPSLPGFGFSDTPPSALSSRETAGLWRRMMNALGHEQFVAHGSDLGAGVTGWLARDHGDAVLGIHLATPGLALPRGVEGSHEEQRFADEVADWNRREGGYMHEHSTKPATLAAALCDSPAGLAAFLATPKRSCHRVTPHRRRPRSRSSAASGSRFPNHRGSSLSASTRSAPPTCSRRGQPAAQQRDLAVEG
jgi:pimeloyl-ACP methyl ester carboxylesterase